MKALYNHRPYRTAKGKNILVNVLQIQELYAEVKGQGFRKWVNITKLKPYPDPNANGSQWLFLNYIITEQIYSELLKYAIYNLNGDFISITSNFKTAKEIILKNELFNKKHP